jgi:hypothetical protein
MNLVALSACPFSKPCAVIVTTMGRVLVMSSGMNCLYVKCERDESGVIGYSSSGCSSMKSYRGLSGSCGFGKVITIPLSKDFTINQDTGKTTLKQGNSHAESKVREVYKNQS